jgi:hypothetical protein
VLARRVLLTFWYSASPFFYIEYFLSFFFFGFGVVLLFFCVCLLGIFEIVYLPGVPSNLDPAGLCLQSN